MLLLIVELLMLAGGLWTAATGKLPTWLVGGGQYIAEGLKVRLLGLWMASPAPLAFIAGIMIALFFGEEMVTRYAGLVEIGWLLVVALSTSVIFRFIRQPITQAELSEAAQTEALIAKKATGALLYAIFSVAGFVVIITGPLAFIHANQALRLIEQHQVGQQYRNRAYVARVLAVVIFLGYASVIACVIGTVLFRGR